MCMKIQIFLKKKRHILHFDFTLKCPSQSQANDQLVIFATQKHLKSAPSYEPTQTIIGWMLGYLGAVKYCKQKERTWLAQ